METGPDTLPSKDRRRILSTVWVFVLFNYVYADLAMLVFSPAEYAKAAAGMSSGTVLMLAALMEVPMAMVLLSWVLPYTANRWANVLAGVEGTAWVGLTLTGGAPPPFYVFIAIIEMAATAFIAWYAWTWPVPDRRSRALPTHPAQPGGSP